MYGQRAGNRPYDARWCDDRVDPVFIAPALAPDDLGRATQDQ
jgi:hypothetical protein